MRNPRHLGPVCICGCPPIAHGETCSGSCLGACNGLKLRTEFGKWPRHYREFNPEQKEIWLCKGRRVRLERNRDALRSLRCRATRRLAAERRRKKLGGKARPPLKTDPRSIRRRDLYAKKIAGDARTARILALESARRLVEKANHIVKSQQYGITIREAA